MFRKGLARIHNKSLVNVIENSSKDKITFMNLVTAMKTTWTWTWLATIEHYRRRYTLKHPTNRECTRNNIPNHNEPVHSNIN